MHPNRHHSEPASLGHIIRVFIPLIVGLMALYVALLDIFPSLGHGQ